MLNARPFVKWAGGKRSVLSEIREHFPDDWPERSLVVPFLGGGALYWSTAQHMAGRPLIADACRPLVLSYLALALDAGAVCRVLDHMAVNKRNFGLARERLSRVNMSPLHGLGNARVCADFIFVNRCGFNGLWRVNSTGGVNVPWGKVPPTHQVLYPDVLTDCGMHLRTTGAVVRHQDFRATLLQALERARSGERLLVFADPPYWPLPADEGAQGGLFGPDLKDSWTGYTAAGFGAAEHVALLQLLERLREAGAAVVSTNHWLDEWVERYRAAGFDAHPLEVRRSINRDAEGRGAVREVVFVG